MAEGDRESESMSKAAVQEIPRPRGRPRAQSGPERFVRIAEAAITCFSELGYRRTQVADIARQMGVAAGTLYLSAESKEALLHLAVMRLCGAPFDDLPAPFPAPPMAETANLLRARIVERGRWDKLTALLASDAVPTEADFAEIGREVYDRLAAEVRTILLIDRCSLDIPELAEVHRDELRGAFIVSLVRLMERRGTGSRAEAVIAARNALEMTTWAAIHRHRHDRLHADGLMPADEVQIRTVTARCFAAILAMKEETR
jgi:AcrR family transcriptional regulator